jgi:hypothetical protein
MKLGRQLGVESEGNLRTFVELFHEQHSYV